MSLVVDALKKLKQENKTTEGIQAPPSMKTEYIINDKSDAESGFAKGIIAVAAVLAVVASAVIGAVKLAGGKDSITKKATIISQKENKPESGTLNADLSPANEEKTPSSPPQQKADSNNPASGENVSDTASKPDMATGKPKEKTGGDNDSGYIDPILALTIKETAAAKPAASEKKETAPKTAKNAPAKNDAEVPAKKTASVKTEGTIPLKADQSPINMGAGSDYLSLLSQGRASWDKKDYKSAVGYYNKAYEMKGEQPVAANIAVLYLADGEPGKAVKTVKKTGIKNIDTVSTLIIAMVDKNFIYEANELIKYSRTLKDNGKLAYAEGYYHNNNRNYQKAAAAFNRARGLAPSEAVYTYSYAKALEADGKYGEALDAYKGVLTLNPDKKIKEYSESRIEALKSRTGR